MVSAWCKGAARAPRIGYRIVFVVIRSRGSVHRTADSVQLAVNGKCRNLVRGAGNGIFRVQVPNVDCALANSAHTYDDTAMITHRVICCSVSLDRMISSYI